MADHQESELEEELSQPGSSDGEVELLDEVMHPFNPADIDIVVEPKSLDTLIKRIKNKEIDMNTDFQRHANLWKSPQMSRLIESILIRFPLPVFYFDASDENNWLIVDGLQRLSSIKKFVLDGDLRLTGLEFLTDLNGKTFDKLPRQYQRRIEECPVTVYMIKPGTPKEVKYSVFRRINTGGLMLNNQEIRNAMANSRERDLLKELANLECTKAMLGDLSTRMKDQELVLRFWAFYRFNYLDGDYKKDMASFLDKAMADIQEGDDIHHKEFKHHYSTAIQRCFQLLGENGFGKKPVLNSGKRFKNSTLFEVWMVTMAKLSSAEFKQLLDKKDEFQSKTRALLEDGKFFDSITYSTQKREHVETRYKKVEELIKEVLNA